MHTHNATNPLRHGFSNATHVTCEALRRGNFLIASQATVTTRTGALRRVVWLTLYGPAWSQQDVRRAERQERQLAASATEAQALEVRDHMVANARTWLSLPLQELPSVRADRASSCEVTRQIEAAW